VADTTSTDAPLLTVEHVRKVYTTDGNAVEAVRDLTFELGRGEFVCLVGPSGCGKTTLLKCIAGLLTPTSGRVTLDGKAVSGPPKKMAVVFQEYGRSLFPWMRVYENVEVPLRNAGVPKAERARLVAEALEAVGLARALAIEPSVLLMDEPFAAVDAQTRADREDLVRQVWRRLGITVLFVTHDIDESVYLAQRVIMLSASPTVVQKDLAIDLPDERDQLETRSMPRFIELRHDVYEQIQRAKRGAGAAEDAAVA
jgi:NitT/TauT family transport system ATP-binding protein